MFQLIELKSYFITLLTIKTKNTEIKPSQQEKAKSQLGPDNL